MNVHVSDTILDLASAMHGRKFRTILADPPWRSTVHKLDLSRSCRRAFPNWMSRNG
jgi:hypothetical protein